MSSKYCYSCGEESILEVDGAAGNSVCTRCGTVLEENAIVSEITFGETSGGAAMVQGSHIGADQTRARAPAGYRQKGGQESREQTLANGRKRMQILASGLRLPDRLCDSGLRYFNLAVNMNFVQGRRTQYVVAACLYTACRMDKTSHMLIDFSDLLEINVFVLGSTYLKLVKELGLQLPNLDPSIYISRFAALLEFGEETQKVAQDAVRLVARMGRDWMHIGRRPAGVCGACLLLAARMNNFRRSVAEVVQVVKIADVTLKKRLDEFKETASGALTVSDFRTLWLDETADPPAFAASQKREKKLREATGELGSDDDLDSVAGAGEDRDAFAELASRVNEDEVGRRGARVSSPQSEDLIPSAKSLGKRKRAETEEVDRLPEETPEPSSSLLFNNAELDNAIEEEINPLLESENGKTLLGEIDKQHLKRLEQARSMTNLNTSNALDDLDEDELDMFILSEKEVEMKSRLWMENNREYLQALADKQTGPDGEVLPEAKRRIRKRHVPRDSNTAQGVDAADATRQLLTKKKFSKKIDYGAISGLFDRKTGSDSDEDDDASTTSSRAGTPFSTGSRAGTPFSSASRAGTPIRKGTPIVIPRPTFSRNGSRAPPARASSVVAEPEPMDEDEAGAMAPPPRPSPAKSTADEEDPEAWRTALGLGQTDEDGEVDWGDEV